MREKNKLVQIWKYLLQQINGSNRFGCVRVLQVLLNHAKGDVFDMVKNLNLPVEHGGGALLKKLQALGLHTNRYIHTMQILWKTVRLCFNIFENFRGAYISLFMFIVL